MRKIDFNHCPNNQEPIQECVADQQNRTTVQFNKSEVAVLIAEMHQLCKAGLGLDLSIQNRSKMEVNSYYDYVSRVLPVLAIEHARLELGLSSKDVSTLFSQKDLKAESYKELFE